MAKKYEKMFNSRVINKEKQIEITKKWLFFPPFKLAKILEDNYLYWQGY